jgi:hypothetical protein
MFGVKKSRPGFDIDDFKTLVRIGEDLGVGLKLDDSGRITLAQLLAVQLFVCALPLRRHASVVPLRDIPAQRPAPRRSLAPALLEAAALASARVVDPREKCSRHAAMVRLR